VYECKVLRIQLLLGVTGGEGCGGGLVDSLLGSTSGEDFYLGCVWCESVLVRGDAREPTIVQRRIGGRVYHPTPVFG